MDFQIFLRRLGSRLRQARWASGLTQEQVADDRITYRYYQEIERGKRNPTVQVLFMLAKVFNTTVAQLVDVDPAATARANERAASNEVNAPKRGRKPKKVTRRSR